MRLSTFVSRRREITSRCLVTRKLPYCHQDESSALCTRGTTTSVKLCLFRLTCTNLIYRYASWAHPSPSRMLGVCKLLKMAGELCKPDSVERIARESEPCAVAIIPLGHDSHRDSSSLPEGCSSLRISPLQRERVFARR